MKIQISLIVVLLLCVFHLYGQGERYQFVKGTFNAGGITVDEQSTSFITTGRISDGEVILANETIVNHGAARFKFMGQSAGAAFQMDFTVADSTFTFIFEDGEVDCVTPDTSIVVYSGGFADEDSISVGFEDHVVSFKYRNIVLKQFYIIGYEVQLVARIVPLNNVDLYGEFLLTEQFVHPMMEVNFVQREVWIKEGEPIDVELELTVPNNAGAPVTAQVDLASNDTPHFMDGVDEAVTFDATGVSMQTFRLAASAGSGALGDNQEYILEISDVAGPTSRVGDNNQLIVHVIEDYMETASYEEAKKDIEPGAFLFFAYDNDIGNDADKIAMSNIDVIQPGTQFQIIKAIYKPDGRWTNTTGDGPVNDRLEITYVGQDPLDVNKIICFDITSDGSNIVNILVDKEPSNLFEVSTPMGASDVDINLRVGEPSFLFLVQGDWLHHDDHSQFLGTAGHAIGMGGSWYGTEPMESYVPPELGCFYIQAHHTPMSWWAYYRSNVYDGCGTPFDVSGNLNTVYDDINDFVDNWREPNVNISEEIPTDQYDFPVDICNPHCVDCCTDEEIVAECGQLRIQTDCIAESIIPQWQYRVGSSGPWQDIAGENESLLIIGSLAADFRQNNNYHYRAYMTQDSCLDRELESKQFIYNLSLTATDHNNSGTACRLTADLSSSAGTGCTDVTYEWYHRGPRNIYEKLDEVSETSAFIDAVLDGDYYVVATFGGGLQRTSAEFEVQGCTECFINVALDDDMTICSGDVYMLNSTVTGALLSHRYLWNNGTTADRISISQAGPYSVTVTDEYGCEAIASFQLSLYDLPVSVASVNDELDCNVPTVTLSTPTCADCTYKWFKPNGMRIGNNDQANEVSTDVPGEHTVEVTSVHGCTSLSTVIVTQDITKPNNPSISDPDPVCHLEPIPNLEVEVDNDAIAHWYNQSIGSDVIYTGTSFAIPEEDQTPGLHDYYVVAEKTSNGCRSYLRQKVTVRIRALPSAPVIDNEPAICFHDPTQSLSVIDDEDRSYNWYASNGAATPILEDAAIYTPTVTDPGTYTYYVVSVDTDTGCPSETRTPITYTIYDLPPYPIIDGPGTKEICDGDTYPTLTVEVVSGHVIDWYRVADNNIADNLIHAGTPEEIIEGKVSYTPVEEPVGEYRYRARQRNVSSTSCNGTAYNTFTIIKHELPLAQIATTNDGKITCEYPVLSYSGGCTDCTWHWTDTEDNVSDIATLTATLEGEYTMTVSRLSASGIIECFSEAFITITEDLVPEPTLLDPDGDLIIRICDGAALPDPLFVLDMSGGYTAHWFTDHTGGTASATGASLILTGQLNLGIHNYYAEYLNGDNNCTSVSRLAVSFEVFVLPDAPITAMGSTDISYCDYETVPELSVTADANQTADWYDNNNLLLSGGTLTYTPSITVDGAYTYQVKARSTGLQACESNTALEIQVIRHPRPVPIVNGKDELITCASDPVLTISNCNNCTYQWSVPQGVLVTDPAQITASVAGNYQLIATAHGCMSDPIDFTIEEEQIDAPVSSDPVTITYCTVDVPAQLFNLDPAPSGYTIRWYNGSNEIVGTGTSLMTSGLTLSAGNSSSFYAVMVKNDNNCESPTRLAVSIEVLILPDVPITAMGNTDISYCEYENVPELSVTVDANQTADWYDNNNLLLSGGTLTYTPSITADGAYTYQVKARSTGAQACESSTSLEIHVTRHPRPVPIVNGKNEMITCASDPVLTISNCNNCTYQWSSVPPGVSIVNPAEVIATVAGNYQLIATANGCMSDPIAFAIEEEQINAPTGSDPATIAHCIVDVPAQLFNLDAPPVGHSIRWYDASDNVVGAGTSLSTASLTLSAGTTYAFYAAGVKAGNNCESAVRLERTLVIPVTPTTAMGNTDISYCEYENVPELSVTVDANQTADWYDNNNLLLLGGSITYTPSITADGAYTYQVKARSTGTQACESSTSLEIHVTRHPRPVPIVNGKNEMITCASDPVLTISNCNNCTYQWSSVPPGVSIANPAEVIASVAGNYQLIATANGCMSDPIAFTIEEQQINAPTGNDPGSITRCIEVVPAQLFNLDAPPVGHSIRWYDASDNNLGTGTSLSTSSLTLSAGNTYAFYAAAVKAGNNCESTVRLERTLIIPATPVVMTSSNPSISICAGDTEDIGVIAGGNDVYWFDSQVGGNLIQANPSSTLTVSEAGFYYAEAQHPTTLCKSASRLVITVVIDALPLKPHANQPIVEVCTGEVIPSLEVDAQAGIVHKWFAIQSGGTSIAEGDDYPATTSGIFYVEAYDSNTACKSTERQKVELIINPLPAAPTSAQAAVGECQTGNSTALAVAAVAGVQFNWYDSNDILRSTNSATYSAPSHGSYYVEANNVNCTNPQRLEIVVHPTPDLPVSPQSGGVCQASIATTLTVNTEAGISHYWYESASVDDDDFLANGSTTDTYIASGPGTYYVGARNGEGCVSSRLPITVHLTPDIPIWDNTSGIGGKESTITKSAPGLLEYCVGTDIPMLSVLVPDENIRIDWYDSNDDSLTPDPGSDGLSYTPTADGVYAVEAVHEITGCISASIEINVQDEPCLETSIASSLTEAVCPGIEVTLTVTAVGVVGTLSYQWEDGIGNSIAGDNSIDVNPIVTTIYNVTITDSGNGLTETETITINVESCLSLSVGTNDQLCYGGVASNVTVNVTGALGAVTYNWTKGIVALETGEYNQNILTTSPEEISTIYTLTVEDQAGMPVSTDVTLTLSSDCIGPQGSATYDPCWGPSFDIIPGPISGAKEPLQFSWNYNNVNTKNITVPTDNNNSILVFDYRLTVTDALGFTKTFLHRVEPKECIGVIVPDVEICAGDSYTFVAIPQDGEKQVSLPLATLVWSQLSNNSKSVVITDANNYKAEGSGTLIEETLSPGSITSSDDTGCIENGDYYDPDDINATRGSYWQGSSNYTAEYKWESSTNGIDFSPISNSNVEDYDPPAISNTRWYRRGDRSPLCQDWEYTDAIKITVVKNYTSAGSLNSSSAICSNLDPDEIVISNSQSPSGGFGGVRNIIWKRNNSTISNENGLDLNKSFDLSSSTTFKRFSKRTGCDTYLEAPVSILAETCEEPCEPSYQVSVIFNIEFDCSVGSGNPGFRVLRGMNVTSSCGCVLTEQDFLVTWNLVVEEDGVELESGTYSSDYGSYSYNWAGRTFDITVDIVSISLAPDSQNLCVEDSGPTLTGDFEQITFSSCSSINDNPSSATKSKDQAYRVLVENEILIIESASSHEMLEGSLRFEDSMIYNMDSADKNEFEKNKVFKLNLNSYKRGVYNLMIKNKNEIYNYRFQI